MIGDAAVGPRVMKATNVEVPTTLPLYLNNGDMVVGAAAPKEAEILKWGELARLCSLLGIYHIFNGYNAH
jgi:hypothetical protein